MSQVLSSLSDSAQATPPRTCLLRDEAFEQLYDLVSLFGKRPIFTVEGELVLILDPGGAHTGLVQGITNVLLDRVQSDAPQRYWIYQERNIRLSPAENPIIPDIAVYDRELRYTEASPVVTPLVVIEVGLSMTQHDHTIKGPRYARAGVPELWLITMPELFRYPVATGYHLDPENRTYHVAVHGVLSPDQGLTLQTVPLQIEGQVLSQAFRRYGIPLAELEGWPEVPAARVFDE